MIHPEFWQGKTVLLTGHTGFKGSWLTLWLEILGAKVIGYALEPPTIPSLFELSKIESSSTSLIGDIRDAERLCKLVSEYQPEIVFHLAAQPLVRLSYNEPSETFATNIMGTVNIMEAIRAVPSVRSAVMVTTDKVYENNEWIWSYRENDRLGGSDPYSASKAASEMVIASYISSYFSLPANNEYHPAIASARAGNVIGGGDWAADRIIPDIIRAILSQESLTIRYPNAVRPWQHVLEPLGGYLVLAERLHTDGAILAGAWNFAPSYTERISVREVVDYISKYWGETIPVELTNTKQPHETTYLQLDAVKASRLLGWKAVLSVEETFAMTVDWYKSFAGHGDMRQISIQQIRTYMNLLEAEKAS